MPDSPLHVIINEIRKNYGGKEASLVDIRLIESKYKICSIINTRDTNTAYLRITSYGLNGVNFEDITFDFSGFPNIRNDLSNFVFSISRVLFGLAYGINLSDSANRLIGSIAEPSFDYFDLRDEVSALQSRFADLENKLKEVNKQESQISLFDYNK